MNLWHQIFVSAGTVLTLLLGFWGISHNLKKGIKKETKALEKKWEAQRATDAASAETKKTKDDAEQRELCERQCGIVETIQTDFKKYQDKQERIAIMQFSVNFTTLEALDKIAHKQPINGEITTQLDDLKKFTIRESLQGDRA